MEAVTAGLRPHHKRSPAHPLSAEPSRLASPLSVYLEEEDSEVPGGEAEASEGGVFYALGDGGVAGAVAGGAGVF